MRYRLSISIPTLIFVMGVMAAGSLGWIDYRAEREDMWANAHRNVESLGALVSNQIETQLRHYVDFDIRSTLEQMHINRAFDAALVLDDQGTPEAATRHDLRTGDWIDNEFGFVSPQVDRVFDTAQSAVLANRDEKAVYGIFPILGTYGIQPIVAGPSKVLLVRWDVSQLSASLASEAAVQFVWNIAIVGLMSMLILGFLNRAFLTRMKTLTETMNRIGEGPLNLPETLKGSDELSAVATELADLSQRRYDYEESLKAAERKFRLLAERNLEAIVVTDLEDRVLFVNRAAEVLFYKSAESMTGSSFGHPAKLDQVSTIEILREPGDLRIGEIWVTATEWEGQGAHLATIRDVTERVRASEERDKLAIAVEQASDAIIIANVDGRIQYVNPAFQWMYGYSAAEAIGSSPDLLQSGEHAESFFDEIWAKVRNGEPWRGRRIDRRKDGEIIHVDLSIVPVRNKAGDVEFFVAGARDVTAFVEADKQLQQAQKLEALGTLAGGIAHDFNNILAAIHGYTSLAMERAPASENYQTDLEQVLESTERARELIHQILAFSRERDYEGRESIDLVVLVNEVLKMLRAMIPTTIEIQSDFRVNEAWIYGNATKMHQVVLNLCTNAYQAMEDSGGRLSIAVESVPLSDDAPPALAELSFGHYIVLTVEDTGIGIVPDALDRIFDPFFTTKAAGQGTGLGLSTVYGVVREYGGAVYVESEVGEGARFCVYLPETTPAIAKEYVEAPRDEVSANGQHIAVIDDEPALAKLMDRHLSRVGFTVSSFVDPVAALDAISADPDRFDAVVTDRTMPKLTGLQLAERLAIVKPGIPVILCTGYADQTDIGANGIVRQTLEKPIDVDILIDILFECLSIPGQA